MKTNCCIGTLDRYACAGSPKCRTKKSKKGRRTDARLASWLAGRLTASLVCGYVAAACGRSALCPVNCKFKYEFVKIKRNKNDKKKRIQENKAKQRATAAKQGRYKPTSCMLKAFSEAVFPLDSMSNGSSACRVKNC